MIQVFSYHIAGQYTDDQLPSLRICTSDYNWFKVSIIQPGPHGTGQSMKHGNMMISYIRQFLPKLSVIDFDDHLRKLRIPYT